MHFKVFDMMSDEASKNDNSQDYLHLKMTNHHEDICENKLYRTSSGKLVKKE